MPYKDLKSRCAKESMKKRYKRWTTKITLECLIHYSGNPPKCACCGESETKFLTIDHVGGKGNQHRKKIFNNPRQGGISFYYWLKKQDYPKGYQVLCFNCNCGKNRNHGVCPHVKNPRNNNEF